MKRITWILIAAAIIAVVVAPSAALANMGPHGSYLTSTDACAGCHRAHTAPSSLTWTRGSDGATRSALLLTNASKVYEFCLACHDATSQGADTNVLDGVYEGTAYGTHQGAMLSGAFGRPNFAGDGTPLPGLYDGSNNRVTSTHVMNGMSWGAFGGGAFGSTSTIDATGNYPSLLGTGNKIVMDCGTCHDPHGSSNYRILRDRVNGVAVGGYTGSEPNLVPTPYVISAEKGFPTAGFLLHTSYVGTYTPDYTSAKYAMGETGGVADASKGMSGWCAGCHTTYTTKASVYNAADGYGFTTRHRHPMNVPLTNFSAELDGRALVVPTAIPLAHQLSETGGNGTVVNTSADWVECLTCHNAHGASTTMTGWANVADPANDLRQNTGATFGGGVPPGPANSDLLKLDNRAVCQACHNK